MCYEYIIRYSLLVWASLIYIENIIEIILFIELLKTFYLFDILLVISCYRSYFVILNILLNLKLLLESLELVI